MKNYTFHWELKSLITQFIGALDDCIVKRYDEDLNIKSEIQVRYVYAPKTRTLHWLVNKQQHITLPVVSVSVAGVTRDQNRVFNKLYGPSYSDEEISNPKQPVPVDITLNVSLLARYENDMDQMVSNFVPYFDQYIVLSWNHPTVNREIRSEVLWDGNLSYSYPLDLNATDSYRIGVDTTFTVKGWLFKNADGGVGEINEVIIDFIGVDDWENVTIDE